MQHGRGGRRQNAQGSKGNQRAIESHDNAVIGADVSGQITGDSPQADQFMEIVRRNSDVHDPSGASCAVIDGNAHIGLGQRRGIVDALPNHMNVSF